MTGPGPTRAAGITAGRGFPYPGSANIHANTPSALQALAEAITGQLTSIGGGMVLDMYAGQRSVTTNTVAQWTTADFPKLASITGLVAMMGGWPNQAYLGGGNNTGGTSPQQTFRLLHLRNRAPAFTGSITVLAVAWGPPK